MAIQLLKKAECAEFSLDPDKSFCLFNDLLASTKIRDLDFIGISECPARFLLLVYALTCDIQGLELVFKNSNIVNSGYLTHTPFYYVLVLHKKPEARVFAKRYIELLPMCMNRILANQILCECIELRDLELLRITLNHFSNIPPDCIREFSFDEPIVFAIKTKFYEGLEIISNFSFKFIGPYGHYLIKYAIDYDDLLAIETLSKIYRFPIKNFKLSDSFVKRVKDYTMEKKRGDLFENIFPGISVN